MEKIQELFAPIIATLQTDSIFAKIIITILMFFVGLNVISLVTKIFSNTLKKRNFDKTLQPFVSNLILWGLRTFLFITTASYLGVETTSFVALLGALGFAIGMAMQGALANFAGGVIILVTKPYKIEDLVEMQDSLGIVKEIKLFNTILLSPENKTIILPNGAVSNGNITNYTVEGLIRVDLSVGISYTADIQKAKDVIMQVLQADERVLKTPAPFVGVVELGDSSVNLAVRPYSNPDNYWDVYFNINEKMKIALDKANIEIPFPQMDIHLDK